MFPYYGNTTQALGFNGHPPLGVNATRLVMFLEDVFLFAFQWAPTLGGECYALYSAQAVVCLPRSFNGHPPLGVNATCKFYHARNTRSGCFNGHPPLGVNATYGTLRRYSRQRPARVFQWAPTLGGECYKLVGKLKRPPQNEFQWAPTLGGECYKQQATQMTDLEGAFQWAPTLGGECYGIVYLITPPLCQGVDALLNISQRF